VDLLTIRTAIVEQLQQRLAPVKVASHGGRFSLKDIQRIAAQTPAVRVGCLGVRGVETSGGRVTVTAVFGAFVITTDKGQSKRDAAGLLLTGQVLACIPGNDFGIEQAEHPVETSIKADNLYSGQLEGKGIALWACTWQQQLEIEALDFDSLADFVTYAQQIDLDPNQDGEPSASDTLTMEQ